jgi:hypothetical protein
MGRIELQSQVLMRRDGPVRRKIMEKARPL